MNKSELVAGIAHETKLTKADAEKALDATFKAITQALVKGDEVRLIGFGVFSVKERPQSEGRNPRTGAPIVIPKKRVPKFQPGKSLKEAIEK